MLEKDYESRMTGFLTETSALWPLRDSDWLNQNFHLRRNPTTMYSRFLLLHQCENRRLAWGERSLILPVEQITTWKGERKQWIWVFLIHPARSNEVSLVTAAHMHGRAWQGQIWHTLKQNTLDICIRVGEETLACLLSVTKCSNFRSNKGAKASSQFSF